VSRPSSLKAWGLRIAKRGGFRRAKVAVARKLAVVLHAMWTSGEEFRWSLSPSEPLAAKESAAPSNCRDRTAKTMARTEFRLSTGERSA
jgi:hypothetical protein